MNEQILLTDGSVNTKSKVGYGAYLSIPHIGLSLDELKTQVRVKRFEETSSTKLELQTFLWALNDIQDSECKLIVYTDSQNIIGLHGRRARFEQNNYRSKKNKRISNYKLYMEFYSVTDRLDCKIIKIRGHKVSSQKNDIDKLFTLVDKASRNALRRENRCQQINRKNIK